MPQVVADDGRGSADARALLFGQEEAPARGPDAEHVEVVGAREHPARALGLALSAQVERREAVGGESVEGLCVVAEVQVVGVRDLREAVAVRRRAAHVDEPRLVAHARQRPQERRVDEAEDRRVRADADGQRHDGHQREARTLQQRPRAEAHVLPQGSHRFTSVV